MSAQRTDRTLEVLLRFQTLTVIVLTGFMVAARVGGTRVSSRFTKFSWAVVMFIALVFAAQNVIGGILLTLAAAWYGWREVTALWPVLTEPPPRWAAFTCFAPTSTSPRC